MIVCHLVVLILDLTSKMMRTMVCFGAYLKGSMQVLRGFVYFCGLCMVIYAYVKDREKHRDYDEGTWPYY